MRTLVIERDKRPRPVVVTPAKGSVGDMTDESQAAKTDIGSIIQRYGGNLADIAGWRNQTFGDQPADDLEDAIETLKNASEVLDGLPYSSLAEAVAAINDGTFTTEKKEEINDEKPQERPETPVEENLSENGK